MTDRWSFDVGDGITVSGCGPTPPTGRDRQALAEVARAAAARFDADREWIPPYVRLVLHNLAEMVEGAMDRRRGRGFTTLTVAREAGVRLGDVVRALQQSERQSAHAANALAEWAGW